ncbi:hypothetical protein BDZ97DRAFT_1754329 [Flammula alnicola]|nr:hypothetical protein BDZ97DRAFT_1754329 [Flammula alnicola]
MSNEAPIVVAPRPVRLSQTFFHLRQDSDDNLKLASMSQTAVLLLADLCKSSSALPSEALEEFLSILTPSFLRKPRSLTFPAILPDHQQQQQRTNFRQPSRGPFDLLRGDHEPRTDDLAQHISQEIVLADSNKLSHFDLDARWSFSSTPGLLSSPISRMQTRNPFQRGHDVRSPVPITPLTPAAVPLPTPTPDELIERLESI